MIIFLIFRAVHELKMKDNGKLAPGVFRNVLSHGLAMAVLPLIAFFLVRAIGFSGITAAVGRSP